MSPGTVPRYSGSLRTLGFELDMERVVMLDSKIGCGPRWTRTTYLRGNLP